MRRTTFLPSAPVLATLVAILVAALALAVPVDAPAAVPHERAVPAYPEEQTILHLEQGLAQPGLASSASGIRHFDRHFIVPPGRMTEQDVILQRGGNTWRVLRNGPIATAAAVVMLGTLVLIALFYRVVGPADRGPPDSGERLLRFTRWQRLVHWSTAVVFVLLALTGLVILFGKNLLLPWMGHEAFSWVAIASKWAHNVLGPLFVLLNVATFLAFVGRNRFQREDLTWLRRMGGMFTHRHVPAPFFNAGEKIFFWAVVTFIGFLVAVTGLMLDFPYFGGVGEPVGFTRYLLQAASLLHLGGAALYITAVMGHAYLGTLGTPGAWEAMRDGTVDASWAQTHHALWYEEATGRRDDGPHATAGTRVTPGDLA